MTAQENKPFRTMGDMAGLTGGTEFPVLVSERKYRSYRIFLDDILEGAYEMRWAVQAFAEANEEDEIYVHVSSGGGSVDSMLTFLQAKNTSKAMSHCIATGTVASAAAIILSDADSFEIDPFCSVLFHSVSFGMGGKSQDVVEYSTFTHDQSRKLLEYYVLGVLLPEEIDDIIRNKRELWVTSKGFVSRMERKARCRKLVLEMVKEQGINPEEAGTEVYVELMTLALKLDEENQSKAPPKKRTSRAKKPSPPSSCNNSCC